MGFSKKKKFTLDHSLDDFDEPVRKDTDISTISGRSSISNPPSYVEDPTEMFETPEEKKLRKRSHWIAYATMFVMTVGFSVVLSGVWPYLEQLEGEGTRTKAALGWVVAANPFGQMLASPVVGYIGNRIGSIRRVCYFTVTCFIFGNFLYAFLPAFNNPYGWMIFSRFIVGISSSNVTLCRSYLASSTTTKERTKGIAIISAAQSLGFVVGPAIQTVLSLTVPDEYKYRSAGWVAAGLGFINLIILNPKFFQEYYLTGKEDKSTKKEIPVDETVLPNSDKIAIMSILLAFFFNQIIVVIVEALMEPFMTDQYAWCHDLAVVVVSVTFMVTGILGVGMYILSIKLSHRFDDRKILLFVAVIPMCIGLALFQPLPGATPLIYCNETSNNVKMNQNLYFNGEKGGNIDNISHQGPAPIFNMVQQNRYVNQKTARFAKSGVIYSPFYMMMEPAFKTKRENIDAKQIRQEISLKDSVSKSFERNVAYDDAINFITENLVGKNKKNSDKNHHTSKNGGIKGTLKDIISTIKIDRKNNTERIIQDTVKNAEFVRTSKAGSSKNKEWCDRENNCYGCSEDQEWCEDYPALPLAQFYVALMIVLMVYPFGRTMGNVILTKILGPQPQGTWMGILTASGSLARVTGPIFVTSVYTNSGTRWVFGIILICTVINLFQILIFYRRLVPMKIPEPTSNNDQRVHT